jgi:hypothetical protein
MPPGRESPFEPATSLRLRGNSFQTTQHNHFASQQLVISPAPSASKSVDFSGTAAQRERLSIESKPRKNSRFSLIAIRQHLNLGLSVFHPPACLSCYSGF